MNKDNAHLYLPLVQALSEGKVIRVLGSDGPTEVSEVYFSFAPECYEIKPEPREWWVVEINKLGESGLGCVGRHTFVDEREAARFATDTGGEKFHVCEVLPP